MMASSVYLLASGAREPTNRVRRGRDTGDGSCRTPLCHRRRRAAAPPFPVHAAAMLALFPLAAVHRDAAGQTIIDCGLAPRDRGMVDCHLISRRGRRGVQGIRAR